MRAGVGSGGLPMTTLAPRRRSWLWLQGLACGGAISVATAPVILVAVLLAPGLVSYAVEQRPGKPVSETMMMLGIATIFMPLRTFWEYGHSFDAATAILTNPTYLGLSWTAACAGWLAEMIGQIIAVQASELSSRRHVAALTREREQLVEEWGSLEAISPPLPGSHRR